MESKNVYFILLFVFLQSCYNQERKCTDFKTGKFEFTQEINGNRETSVFERTESLQIESFRGKIDSSSVRWVNDCEFILQKINPKNMEEKKGIHIKMLSTDSKGYIFEYSYVGNTQKNKGKAIKID